MCRSCNRGLWIQNDLTVTVEEDAVVKLKTVVILRCFKCGREGLLDLKGDGELVNCRSEKALALIAAAIDREWTSKKPPVPFVEVPEYAEMKKAANAGAFEKEE
jgi:hypothetical protein